MNGGFGLPQVLFVVLWAAVVIVPFWKIYEKAGFPAWLGLLMIIPLVNLVVLYYVAFASWPARPAT